MSLRIRVTLVILSLRGVDTRGEMSPPESTLVHWAKPQAELHTRAMFSKHLRRWGCTAVGSFVCDRISSSSSSDRK